MAQPHRLPDVGARDLVRKLRAPQGVGPDVPREVRMRHELARRLSGSRRHQSDPLAVILPDQAHRLGDVAVVADHHRAIVRVEPAVIEQVDGEIYVRALLLGADHLRGALVTGRLRERRAHLVAEEVPEIHLDLGPVASKSAEIDVLALGFRRVGGGARHPRREILDRQDIVMRLQDRCEQRQQVEPFPRRSLERSIVEIEAVHIDEGAHRCPPQKARASEEAPRPAVETARGVAG